MKILFLTYESIAFQKGGPKTQLIETKKELEKLNVKVDLFNPWEKINFNSYDFAHLFSANLSTFNIARNLFEQKMPFVSSPIFFTRHSQFYLKNVIAVENFLKIFKQGIYTDYSLTNKICDWSKLILPNTTDEAKLIENGFAIKKNKIQVIPNGVSEKFLKSQKKYFKNKFGLDNFILSVGHIGPKRKNVLNLIKALQKINYPSVIIGRNDNSKYAMECINEAKKSKNIFIIDYLENSSQLLSSAYACSDVFVLPSLYETPGIAALEAGISGSKIVITPFGGTKDYFENFAEYVNPFSIDSIQTGIEKKLNEPKNPALQTHIKNNFLWKHVAQKTLSAYKINF